MDGAEIQALKKGMITQTHMKASHVQYFAHLSSIIMQKKYSERAEKIDQVFSTRKCCLPHLWGIFIIYLNNVSDH